MWHRSGMGDRPWEVPGGTGGWCREMRNREEITREELRVWAFVQALPPICCVTSEKSLTLSELLLIHV